EAVWPPEEARFGLGRAAACRQAGFIGSNCRISLPRILASRKMRIEPDRLREAFAKPCRIGNGRAIPGSVPWHRRKRSDASTLLGNVSAKSRSRREEALIS